MAKKKILIIEDDSSLAGALSGKLQEEGYEVFISMDGESGLRMIEEKNPDIVLLDLVLPKKHGFQILEELKRNHALPSLLVVILTNLESNYDIERAFSFGIRAYLVKANYSLEEVAKKIKDILP